MKRSRLGCGLAAGGCVLAIVVCVGGCGFMGSLPLVGLLMSDPYKMAVARVQASPEVVKAFGGSVKLGFPMGNIDVHPQAGSAGLNFSITGPAGKGTVAVKATKSAGGWKIDSLVVTKEGGALWDLTP